IVGGATSISICANDGISDAFDVELSGNTGDDLSYFITDESGDFLAVGLPGPTFDLEGAGNGTCMVWAISSIGTVTGIAVGSNINGIQGCFALSNPIVVERNMQGGGMLTTSDGLTSVTICAGDGIPNPIDVILTGNTGSNIAYIVTDAASGNILAIPPSPPFDLDGAGLGVCNIYAVSFEGMISGLTVGANFNNISGCFGLSNPIEVIRNSASAASISANGQTVFNICSGDGVPDVLNVDVTGGVGTTEIFFTTDQNGNIIRVLNSSSSINFDGFGGGTCLLYHVIYDGTISGITQGQNISNIGGCFGLSNAITVTKQTTTGGVFSTNNMTFVSICDGDGSSESIMTTLNNNMGANVEYFIADEDGVITQFIAGPPFDFSSFDRGRFSLYAFSFDGPSSGLVIGQNVSTLVGACNGLSNPITISRGRAVGGTISSPLGNNFDICVQGNVSDGIDINLTGADFGTSRYIITDLNGNIIGLPGPPPINIEIAGNVQTCQIYHLSFDAFFTGLALGNNISNFDGCFDLSNAITINKSTTNGGVLSAPGNVTSVNLCNNGSGVNPLSLSVSNVIGDNQLYILTDQNNMIISTQNNPNFDFSGLPTGSFRIHHLSYNGTLSGATTGSNISAVSSFCFDFSNFVSVSNNSVSAGTVSSPLGNNFSVCVGNGASAPVDFSVTGGSAGRYIITDANGVITNLPGNPPFNLSTTGTGVCVVRFLSSSGNVGGLNVGLNISDITGCTALSNAITINKINVNGGVLALDDNTTTTTVCVGDGVPDLVNVVLNNATGTNNQFIITDSNNNILGLPAAPPFDFDGAGLGACNIYNFSYEGTLTGAMVGSNLSGVSADCFGLSNPVVVNRVQPDAGTISSNGATEVQICIVDPTDLVPVTVTGGSNAGTKGFVITDAATGTILGLPAASPFDLTGAGVGLCNIYRICSVGGLTGLTPGNNLFTDVVGCFDLSNPVAVTRIDGGPGTVTTSKLTFGLDACMSDSTDGSAADYTEFTGVAENDPACTQYSVVGGNLFRNNPTVNTHSCTEGVNGTTAMCVSSLDDCTFEDNSDLAIRFDVSVAPGSNGTGSISELSFFEAAPVMYSWINGASGPNNYPTNYGVRILKDGVEVFRSVDMLTTNDYTLETFDFTNNPEFTVTQTSVFSFELLGYCLVGANSTVAAWDVDMIMLTSNCMTAGGCDTSIVEEEEEEEETINPEEEEEVSALSFKVFPNPVSEVITIQTNQMPMEGTMVYVYDRVGQLTDSFSVTAETLQVELDKYSDGFYYIRMISGNEQITKKFLKATN
ncbi:T9SS type A sorting domain-containing protein, partial [Saprospiraceae bacterium]|nr:T9SS type A sorting domain-containing protein [Saprospiraceae bacterium]